MSRAAILQSPLAVTAMGIAALVTVGACAPTSTSSSGGSGSVTAMCSLTSLPRPSATPPPTRYPLYDAPLLQTAVDAGGTAPDVIGTPFPLPYC